METLSEGWWARRRLSSRARLAVVFLCVLLCADGPVRGIARDTAPDEALRVGTVPTAGKLRASPSDPIAGERVRLEGRVAPRVGRRVVLQVRKPSGWSKVAGQQSREDGRFRFVTWAGRSIATYRVLAPRTIVGGHTYAAMHTRRRRVAPVAQEGVLKMAATAGVGAATPVTARFTPTRPGRRVRLELRSAGKWARVASGREGPRGRVSFSVTHGRVGTYRYRAVAMARHGARSAATPARVLTVGQTAPPPGPRFVTSVSSNGRYFLDQDGHPILVKGDSPWAILLNSSTASMDRYLETRAGQGFNVALVSLMGNTANGGPSDSGATYDGVPPFVGGDPTRLNGAYWDRVDHFISKAASLGITVMAFPLDGWNGTSTFGGLAAGWSTTTAQAYGKALAARLSGHPNLIYATGGDFPNSNGGADDDRFWAVLTGLATAGAQRLETIQFERGETSLDSTFWDEKVQYNFVYPHALTYALLENAYQDKNPAGNHIPALVGETYYEGRTDVGITDDSIRAEVAWALTSGSPGEFYGSENIWDEDPTVPNMNTTTVAQVSALRAAFEKLDGWQELVPDFGSTFITAGRGDKGTDADIYATGDTYVTGAVTPDGRLAVVYLPSATSQTISIDQSKMAPGYTARWVDPTTGASTPAATGATYHKDGANAAGDPDWLLVLESSAPGSSR